MPPREPLRLIFAGTPAFAAEHLRALLASRHELAAVYTQPDRPAGRGRKLLASPVKRLAERAGIPVRQPASLAGPAGPRELAALRADAMVVVAYGLILPQAALDAPRLGCVNVHASLLPRWRGAAPIQRCLEAGDSETGISIMRMDAGLDTGPLLARARLRIEASMTAGELHDALLELGPTLLCEVLERLGDALAEPQAQGEGATYARKVRRDDARLDWRRSNVRLHDQVRAFNPAPGAWTSLAGAMLKVWRAAPRAGPGAAGEILGSDAGGITVACGAGALRVSRVQLSGGRAMEVRELLNSRREQFRPGAVLGH